jgi:antitoxin PrlF
VIFVGAATLTSKGQITLPAGLRHKWGIKAGDAVEFFEGADGSVKVRSLAKPASAVVGLMAHLRPDPRYGSDDDALAEAIADEDVTR